MNTQGVSDTQKSSQETNPRLPHSFNYFIQLSRKLGVVAAKSSVSDDAGLFLNREETMRPSERLFSRIVPKIALTRPSSGEGASQGTINLEKEMALKKIVTLSHEVLMSANTIFPMTLFPSSVTVDRTKITITKRDFFWSADVLSIRVEDVLNVQASVGPFFGSLTIASRVMSTVDHFQIRHLWRQDAIRLKRIIQGYVIAQHNQIDTSHLDRTELVETLVELGQDTNTQ